MNVLQIMGWSFPVTHTLGITIYKLVLLYFAPPPP